MWYLLAALLVGIFLLGCGTALWLTAKLFSLIAGHDHAPPGGSSPHDAAPAGILRQLRARVDGDHALGLIGPDVRDQLVSYLAAAESVQAAGPAPADMVAGARSFSLAAAAAGEAAEQSYPAAAALVDAPAVRGGLVGRISASLPGSKFLKPETVRILQSLGIFAVFASVVAFVHGQLWTSATAIQQICLLLTATALCHGLGLALCQRTLFRATGIGFLVLGQAGVLLDCQVALALSWNGQPLSGGLSSWALWACAVLLVAATAAAYAYTLREPFFDALTVLSTLTGWGLAVCGLGMPLCLLPATYVPVLFLARALCRPPHGETGQPLQRWDLSWWLEQFTFGCTRQMRRAGQAGRGGRSKAYPLWIRRASRTKSCAARRKQMRVQANVNCSRRDVAAWVTAVRCVAARAGVRRWPSAAGSAVRVACRSDGCFGFGVDLAARAHRDPHRRGLVAHARAALCCRLWVVGKRVAANAGAARRGAGRRCAACTPRPRWRWWRGVAGIATPTRPARRR